MAGEIGAFLGGLTGSTVGSAVVRLVLDATQYTAGLAKANAELQGTAAKSQASASKATGAWSMFAKAGALAAAAAVAASVKMAMEFEAAFTRIDALSNTSARNIEEWKGQVLDLAGKTAKAPAELADALFFLSSAGLEANDVMPALEASAKAAAAGLGETKDIANVVASAMNAYAKSGLTASEVTDTLVAAVREGRAEPEEFAVALGRILPIASKAGVEFDEVAASLATLSNIGLDVNEGVTAMRGLLNALEAPSNQAQEALAGIGLSAEDVRRVLAQDGLLAAMRLLEERTGGNIDVLRDIIPNIRAMTGAFGHTTQAAERVDAVYRNVRDAVGSTDQAFAEAAKSTEFQMRRLGTQLQVVAIRIGSKLLPVINALVDVLNWMLANLPTVTGYVVVFGAAWAATNWASIATALLKVRDALVAVMATSKGLPGVIGALAYAIGTVPTQKAADDADAFNAQLKVMQGAFVRGTIDQIGGLAKQVSFLSGEYNKNAEAVELAIRKNISYEEALEQVGGAERDATAAAAKHNRALKGLTRTTEKDLKEWSESAKASIDSAATSVTDYQEGWELTSRELAQSFRGMRQEQRTFARDMRELSKEAIPLEFKQYLINEGPDAVHAFATASGGMKRSMVEDWRGIMKSTDDARDSVDKMGGALDRVKGRKVQATVGIRYEIVGNLKPADLPGLGAKAG